MPGEMFCQNCGVQLPPVASTPPPPPAPVVDTHGHSEPGLSPEKRQGLSSTSIPGGNVRTGQVGDQIYFSGKLVLRNKGIELPLPPDQPVLVIGRTDSVQDIYPDVDLSGLDGERSGVSRRHARILQKPDGVYIEDLNSTNFTFLNHTRLQPGQPYLLKNGDEIRLGALTLEYRS